MLLLLLVDVDVDVDVDIDVDVDDDVDDVDICNDDDEPHSSAGLVLTVLCSHSLQSPLNINPCRLTASAIYILQH